MVNPSSSGGSRGMVISRRVILRRFGSMRNASIAAATGAAASKVLMVCRRESLNMRLDSQNTVKI